MDNREWEDEYEHVLEESTERGEIKMGSGEWEHRKDPRLGLKHAQVWIKVDLPFEVIDISISGISFYSTTKFIKDQTFAITLGKAFVIEALVVDCQLVETDKNMMEAHYRTACSFENPETGRQFLVMLKEADDTDISILNGKKEEG